MFGAHVLTPGVTSIIRFPTSAISAVGAAPGTDPSYRIGAPTLAPEPTACCTRVRRDVQFRDVVAMQHDHSGGFATTPERPGTKYAPATTSLHPHISTMTGASCMRARIEPRDDCGVRQAAENPRSAGLRRHSRSETRPKPVAETVDFCTCLSGRYFLRRPLGSAIRRSCARHHAACVSSNHRRREAQLWANSAIRPQQLRGRFELLRVREAWTTFLNVIDVHGSGAASNQFSVTSVDDVQSTLVHRPGTWILAVFNALSRTSVAHRQAETATTPPMPLCFDRFDSDVRVSRSSGRPQLKPRRCLWPISIRRRAGNTASIPDRRCRSRSRKVGLDD